MDVLFFFLSFFIYICSLVVFVVVLSFDVVLFCLYCELIVFPCVFSSVLFDLIFCQLLVVF